MKNAYINVEGIRERFNKAQAYLDNRVLVDSTPLVPIREGGGGLRGSGQRGTVIGSGEVVWAIPYAHYIYTGLDMIQEGTENRHFAEKGSKKVYNGKKLTFEQGKEKWYEEAKKKNLKSWISGVGRIIDG